jgi:hypothetical protein
LSQIDLKSDFGFLLINQQLMGRQPRVETGLDDSQIKALRQAASAAGGPPPRDTGNAFFNSLIAQIRGLG